VRFLGFLLQLGAIVLLIYLGMRLTGSSTIDDAASRFWAEMRTAVESK
jgi:hypothetical protein